MPPVSALPRDDPEIIPFTMDQVDALKRAAPAATWPSMAPGRIPLDYSPQAGWDAFFAVMLTWGPRPGEVVSTGNAAAAFRWCNFTRSTKSPAPGGSCENEHGWFEYLPRKTRKHRSKKRKLCLPVTGVLLRYLNGIGYQEKAGVSSDPVFNWSQTRRNFYDQFAKLRTAARIGPVSVEDQHGREKLINLGPHNLRKTCETELDCIDPDVGPMVVGHAPRDVAHKYYISNERRILAALNALDYPAAFMQS